MAATAESTAGGSHSRSQAHRHHHRHYHPEAVLSGNAVSHAVSGHICYPSSFDIVSGKVDDGNQGTKVASSEEMAGDESTSVVGSGSSLVNSIQCLVIHPSFNIDVVKFDGTNNFGLWRCEVRDALLMQGLEETVELQEKPEDIEEKVWIRKNRMACGVIRSCLTQDLKYDVMNESSAKKMWEFLASKYLNKSVENRLCLKRKLFRFRLKAGVSISDHINAYTKLLADLANVDAKIEDEDKALILLISLPDEEYENFIFTLIYGKSSLSYIEVTTALVNYELWKKDKESSSSTTVEVSTARGRSPNRNGKINGKSKSRSGYRSVGPDQCAFCKETGHWKKDCAKLKKMNEKNKQRGRQCNQRK